MITSRAQQKVAGMVYAAKNTPRAFNELVASGADPGQIPPWFMRPGEDPPSKTPPKTPITTTKSPTPPLETSDTLGRTQEIPPPREEGQEVPLGTRRTLGEGGTALNPDDPPEGRAPASVTYTMALAREMHASRQWESYAPRTVATSKPLCSRTDLLAS